MNSKSLFLVPCFIVFFSLCSCTTEKAQAGLETATVTITGETSTVTVEAELARTEDQRLNGLMYRKKLEDGKGMLFIFETDQVLSFWMKNTSIPLSIAFIAYDGTITDIINMYPHNTTSVHSSRMVRYALEVPQGWFSAAGVKPGDRVAVAGF
jgi:uncharacterized membrane protein (UPF0127 family)